VELMFLGLFLFNSAFFYMCQTCLGCFQGGFSLSPLLVCFWLFCFETTMYDLLSGGDQRELVVVYMWIEAAV